MLHLEGYLDCMHHNFNQILCTADCRISSKISFISPVSPKWEKLTLFGRHTLLTVVDFIQFWDRFSLKKKNLRTWIFKENWIIFRFFFFLNKKTSSWWTNLVIESFLLYFPYKVTSGCNSSLSLSPLTKGLHFLIWISVCLIYEVLTLLNSLFNLHETQWNEPW